MSGRVAFVAQRRSWRVGLASFVAPKEIASAIATPAIRPFSDFFYNLFRPPIEAENMVESRQAQ
jgi:hypothetical protein